MFKAWKTLFGNSIYSIGMPFTFMNNKLLLLLLLLVSFANCHVLFF